MTAHADRQEVKASIDSSCPNEEECGRREAKAMRPSGSLTARPAFPPRLRSEKNPGEAFAPLPGQISEKGDEEKGDDFL